MYVHNNKSKETSNDNFSNNRTKMLSSYLPKDVLEEIDINYSSKTNSLSKNSSSDKSMDKSTKSQTNNNNGNNNNSDSNNSNNSNKSNSNKSGSNNNKRDNSNSSGNSNGNSNNNERHMNRKIYNSHPKKNSYQINPKLFKNLLPHNYFTNTIINNSNISESKNVNNNRIDINKINNSFNGNNLNINLNDINNNINNINNININGINNINEINENSDNINNKEPKNMNKIFLDEENEENEKSEKNISTKFKRAKKKKIKKINYSNLDLTKLHNLNYSNNSFRYKNINNNMNGLGNNHNKINHNINHKGNQQTINKIYSRINNNLNDKIIDAFNNSKNIIEIKNGYGKILTRRKNGYISKKNNYKVNMINEQINNELNSLYQINNINNNINHNNINPNFNYINNINNCLSHSMNDFDLNLYNIYQNNKNIVPYNIQNLSSSLDLYQINNLYSNNLGNFNNINIYGNNIINSNYKNANNLLLDKLSNINKANYNNINLINYDLYNYHNMELNSNHQINHNRIQNHNFELNINPQINHNHNNNHNIKNDKFNNKVEISDLEIDNLFTHLYTLPKEVCLLLYIINKKGIYYFISLTKTIKGSKYLQNMLNINPPKEVEVDYIIKIICSNYKTIMCDYYANYFLQKFFKFCDSKHRYDILNSIKDDYIFIANDICGNHSLQCLISLQNTNKEKELLKLCIQDNLKELCYGGNSSHVISKIIKTLKESERQYINNYIINDLINLCLDSNGICVIKEFIYNVKSNYFIKLIINCFEKETNKLTLNQFGNFVIQEVIKFFGYNYCKNIVNNLINNIVQFSISKFSSNVIDFLLEYLSKKQFFIFCKALKKIFLKENNFKEMIKNKYSIYVIENCLELLIKINENYYIHSIKNNLGNNFILRKNSDKSKNGSKNSLSDSDSEEENGINGEKKDEQNDCEYSYEKFCKLKLKIFQFIDNNSAAKEKKKILALIKVNKHKSK